MATLKISDLSVGDWVEIDHNKTWTVEYSNIMGELFSTYRTELIDALYDMVIKLKEEGVI
jgi:hypothetical protein